MTHLQTPETSPLYPVERVVLGYVPNYVKLFALRPEVYAGWRAMATAIKGGMDERRYELVTVAAARRLHSRYCELAHEKVLWEKFADQREPDELELSMMDFAGRVAADPTTIEASDVEALRARGLSDEDILQLVLAACARRFFSGVLAALGVEPDPELAVVNPRC